MTKHALRPCRNTCFANATLQCLFHAPAFGDFLEKHAVLCKCELTCYDTTLFIVCMTLPSLVSSPRPDRPTGVWCILCELAGLLTKTFSGAFRSFAPTDFMKKLHLICSRFCLGRQEDAQVRIASPGACRAVLDMLRAHFHSIPILFIAYAVCAARRNSSSIFST